MEIARLDLGVEPVHDLRVALRRYIEALRVLEPWTGSRYSSAIRLRLKPLRQVAGDVRDLDVAAGLLLDAQCPLSLRMRREAAARLLERALAEPIRPPRPPRSPGADAPRPASVARQLLPSLAEDYCRRGRKLRRGDPPAAKLHAFRIRTKRFRYTLEIFASVYGPGLQLRLKRLRDLQDALGDINDCESLRQLPQASADRALRHWIDERILRRTRDFRRLWKRGFSDPAFWIGYTRRWARDA